MTEIVVVSWGRLHDDASAYKPGLVDLVILPRLRLENPFKLGRVIRDDIWIDGGRDRVEREHVLDLNTRLRESNRPAYLVAFATVIAAAAAETDLPPGVLNIVTTSDNSVAEILTRHPDIDQVAFTGSTATGRLIMANGAATVKRISLELGGKSALIVLDEESLLGGVGTAAGTICVHAGQGCTHYTRLLVPAHLLDAATEIAKGAMEAMPYGDPMDMNHLMGPLISQRQLDRVLGYLELGRSEGRLVTGGGRATQFERGYFVQPTVFTDVPNSARIAREEIFGPVLSIIPFSGGDDEAVAIANDSTFGLSGGVFSVDTPRATAVAHRLRTGTVSVNGAPWFDVDSPFGGYKQSGLGREFGREGLEDFMEIKTLSYPV